MNTIQSSIFFLLFVFRIFLVVGDTTPQSLPYTHIWSPSDVQYDDDWSTGNAISGWVGYKGYGNGVGAVFNSTIITIDTSNDNTTVHANQNNPDTYSYVGYEIIQFVDSNSSATEMAMLNSATTGYLLLHLDTNGVDALSLSFTIEDLDSTSDSDVAQFAVYYHTSTFSANEFHKVLNYDDVTIANSTYTTLVTSNTVNGPFGAITRIAFMTSATTEPVGIQNINIQYTASSPSPSPSSKTISSPSASSSTTPSFGSTPTASPSGTPANSATPSPTPSVSPGTASSSPSVTPSASPNIPPSATTTPSVDPGDSSSSGPNTAAIAGGVAGGGSGCLIIVVGLVFWMRRRKKMDDSTDTELEIENDEELE